MYYVTLILTNPLGTNRDWKFLKYIYEEKKRSLKKSYIAWNQNGFCKQSHDKESKSTSPINEKYASLKGQKIHPGIMFV